MNMDNIHLIYRMTLMCMCIYIYIHYQSKVFGIPQKFLFLFLKILSLMKQFKHHCSLIYYTKYKSSLVILTLV